MAMDIDNCKQTHVIGSPQLTDTIFIGWKRPQENWVKLNCDGRIKAQLISLDVVAFSVIAVGIV